MIIFLRFVTIICILCLFNFIPEKSYGSEKQKEVVQDSTPRPVLSVNYVNLVVIPSNPPKLQVGIFGRVLSSYWKNPRCILRQYVTPPEDGIYDFDVVADSPENVNNEGTEEKDFFRLYLTIDDDFSTWKGLRFISATNQIEKSFSTLMEVDDSGILAAPTVSDNYRPGLLRTWLIVLSNGQQYKELTFHGGLTGPGSTAGMTQLIKDFRQYQKDGTLPELYPVQYYADTTEDGTLATFTVKLDEVVAILELIK